jgi:methylenetetrahydrofolate reductase (NADPH)
VTPAVPLSSFADNRVAACAAELIVSGSLDLTPDRAGDAEVIAAQLPAGTRVYLTHLPHRGLMSSLDALARLHDAGLDPVPHIAARRVTARSELEGFLEQAVRELGVSKVLLIGGDDPAPAGPYVDAAALLRERILADQGIREVGLPGYPEGHPLIPRARIERALEEKLTLAAAQGIGSYIVTQFSLAPARVVEYCNELARKVPSIPVFVGMAGPSNPAALLRFAQRCGVSASLRALQDQGMGAVWLFTHSDPTDQVTAVAHYCLQHTRCNVVGVHFFCFGPALKAAAWMNRAITARSADR